MRLALCHIVLFFAFALGAFAQEAQRDSMQVPGNDKRLAQNTVFLELIGNGLFYSVNYERSIAQNFSLRIGVSFVPRSGSIDAGIIPILPVLVNV